MFLPHGLCPGCSLLHALTYFIQVFAQCHFPRRPSLIIQFKIKILPCAAHYLPSTPSYSTSSQSTRAGCSPFTLGILLTLSSSSSVLLRLFCMEEEPLCTLASSWICLMGGTSRALEGERREKPGCLFSQQLSVQGLWLGLVTAARLSQGPLLLSVLLLHPQLLLSLDLGPGSQP